MSQEIIDALFTGDSRRIKKDVYGRRSTGLGMVLVKNMIEKNGGTIHIYSEQEKGTSVTVALPINVVDLESLR